MAVFAEYANYYDLLNTEKNYRAEAEYIDGLIRRFNSSGKLLLNLGCGTGKHDRHLSGMNYMLTGVDLSEEMIDRARMQGLDIEFIVGDARSIRLDKKFNAVISLFHVASYQNTEEDLKRYFETACSHLKQEGVFVFDLWHGPAVLADGPIRKVRRGENAEVKVIRTAIPEIFSENRIIKVNFDFEIIDKKKGAIHRMRETHSMRYWFPEEIHRILAQSGFKLRQEEQWMTGSPPSDKTWYVTYVATTI